MRRWDYMAEDGREISVAEWRPKEPVGMVQISHGMAEHILRYTEFAEFLCAQGFLVFGDDHRAFGETDRKTIGYAKGNIWEDTLTDLYGITCHYRQKYPTLPLVLFGHSYGSFLTQAYLERYGRVLNGAILSGSCCMNDLSVPFGLLVAKIGCACFGETASAYLLQRLTFDAYNKKYEHGEFLNSLDEETELYHADMLCGTICSYGFYRSFFAGLKKVYRKQNYLKLPADLPVLLLAGKEDPVGYYGAGVEKLYQFYVTLGMHDVSKQLFDGCRHEILRDTCKKEVQESVLTFLRRIQ